MPCVYVETGYLKDLLAITGHLPPHNWLISGLECYDYEGWDGCEKWAKTELFLTCEELRRDVNLRNMQIIWGVFSMIPAERSKEEVFAHPLPESETNYYMRNRITPRHPLATLEIYVCDGWFTEICAHDAALLEPFYQLPYQTHDEEASNRIMNAQLRRVQDVLHAEVPDVPPGIANRVQWKVWYSLLKDNPDGVRDKQLRSAVKRKYASVLNELRMERLFKLPAYGDYWDPYTQE